MKTKRGFTLIEIIITITITALIFTIGISAYGKARDRQIGQSAADKIITILKESQQAAAIGKKDNTTCIGAFQGQQVAFSPSSTTPAIITVRGRCAGGLGAATTIKLPDITFTSNVAQDIIFNPISGGATIGGASELFINFTTTSLIKYRIRVTPTGTIEYQGVQP